jgi:hypothetical protein
MENTAAHLTSMEPSRQPAVPAYKIWLDSPLEFSSHRIQQIRHNFHEHPLLQLPQLAELAHELWPAKQCRFITPGSTQSTAFHHGANTPDGRTLDDVFRRIDEPGSWIALYNVETVPRYAQLLESIIGTVKEHITREQPGIFEIGGFIFISSAPSVTPFHIDRENNFWLQIRGKKQLNVWDNTDRKVVPAEQVEKFIVYASLEDVKLRDGDVERSHEFHNLPGDGVYFPSTSPHMTRCDPNPSRPQDNVSISIGVVFYTDVTRRHANVHAINMLLRRFGLHPSYPGERAWLDALKYPLGRSFIWLKKTFRGYKPRVGL